MSITCKLFVQFSKLNKNNNKLKKEKKKNNNLPVIEIRWCWDMMVVVNVYWTCSPHSCTSYSISITINSTDSVEGGKCHHTTTHSLMTSKSFLETLEASVSKQFAELAMSISCEWIHSGWSVFGEFSGRVDRVNMEIISASFGEPRWSSFLI